MPSKRAILQFDLNGEFIREWESIAAAGLAISINPGGISRCCNGKMFQSGGFMWAYKDSPYTINKLIDDSLQKVESLPNEIWKDIRGFEGYYQISTFGRVKSLSRAGLINNGTNTRKEVLITPHDKGDGYMIVMLGAKPINAKTKMFLVHRLVAEAFIPNPEQHPCVNHKDEIKSNNHVDNLEWCTYRYNVNYSLHKRKRKRIC